MIFDEELERKRQQHGRSDAASIMPAFDPLSTSGNSQLPKILSSEEKSAAARNLWRRGIKRVIHSNRLSLYGPQTRDSILHLAKALTSRTRNEDDESIGYLRISIFFCLQQTFIFFFYVS
jgi:hypothetical protein